MPGHLWLWLDTKFERLFVEVTWSVDAIILHRGLLLPSSWLLRPSKAYQAKLLTSGSLNYLNDRNPGFKLYEGYFASSSSLFQGCSSKQRINIPGFMNSYQSPTFVTLTRYSLQKPSFSASHRGTPGGKTASLLWTLSFSEISARNYYLTIFLKLFRRFYFYISSNLFGCLHWEN